MRTPNLLSDPAYHDEDAARAYLEEVRWPDGPFCPFCGSLETVKPLGGPSMGPGWYYCSACQDKFTVRVGSIFERSHIPIHKWLLAFRLMTSSKKGVSTHQIHRTLGITYKSAWFLTMRIREAMTDTDPTPLGGEGTMAANPMPKIRGTSIMNAAGAKRGWHGARKFRSSHLLNVVANPARSKLRTSPRERSAESFFKMPIPKAR
jgi:transposase-like protein